MPREDNLFASLALYVLADVLLEHLISHPGLLFMSQEIRLVQIKAVVAIDIALCAGWLGHRMKTVIAPRWESGQVGDWFAHDMVCFEESGIFMVRLIPCFIIVVFINYPYCAKHENNFEVADIGFDFGQRPSANEPSFHHDC